MFRCKSKRIPAKREGVPNVWCGVSIKTKCQFREGETACRLFCNEWLFYCKLLHIKWKYFLVEVNAKPTPTDSFFSPVEDQYFFQASIFWKMQGPDRHRYYVPIVFKIFFKFIIKYSEILKTVFCSFRKQYEILCCLFQDCSHGIYINRCLV